MMSSEPGILADHENVARHPEQIAKASLRLNPSLGHGMAGMRGGGRYTRPL